MTPGTRRWVIIRMLFFILFIAGLWAISVAFAQEGTEDNTPEAGQGEGNEPEAAQDGEEATPSSLQGGAPVRLYITDSDTSSIPAVILRSYGFAGDGRPLNFADEPLVVRHGSQLIEQVDVAGSAEVGTYTVFLLDITTGVESQIPAIQQAIEQFASAAYMKEQVDAITIYNVGESEAGLALEPTMFYNSVRNFFATPLEPQAGATALIDSLVGLLNSMESSSPDPQLISSIVVFSDGTDAVSTRFDAGDVAARAVALGIPVHTIWLENPDLSVGQEAGRNYLTQVANDAYGVAGRIDQPDSVNAIFDRIIAFREQSLVRYNVPTITGGTTAIELSLQNQPDVQARTEITVSASAPTVTLNIPTDSRTLQLPTLDEPVRLALSADVGWLDETERTLDEARLIINGQTIHEVPVEHLDRFEVEIVNFVYGENQLQLSVTDEQGMEAASPAIALSVVEGEERQIPEALGAGSGIVAAITAIIPVCLGGIALLAIVGLGGFLFYRRGRLPDFRPSRARRLGREEPAPDAAASAPGPVAPMSSAAPAAVPAAEAATQYAPAGATQAAPAGPATAYLEVLETETQMPSHIPLRSDETRLGRSPALADVAFEQDITVSRLHATILWDGHSFRLYDDDSTSGTWVNDQEVPDYGVQLFDGDDIFLGKVHLRFRQR